MVRVVLAVLAATENYDLVALPSGPRTRAVFLKPAGATGRLPAVLARHDHGGISAWGVEKITRIAADDTQAEKHQATFYGRGTKSAPVPD